MLNKFVELAPTISTVFFFLFFMVVMVWVMIPRNKQRIESFKEIPLRESEHGR